KNAVGLTVRALRCCDVDTASDGQAPAVLAEAVRRGAADQRVERASALIAPHDAVDIVAAAVILDDGVPPRPVVRMVNAWRGADAVERIDLKCLGQVRDRDHARGAVTLVVKERLHDLGVHLHAASARLRNDQLEHVDVLQFLVLRAEALDERVAIVLWMLADVGATLERLRVARPVVGPPVDLPGDPATDFQTEPGNRADQEDVDAETLLEHVEQRPDAFVDEAHRTDLAAYKLAFYVHLRVHRLYQSRSSPLSTRCVPFTKTCRTFPRTRISASGLPSTVTRSASLPSSTVPRRSA